MTSSSSDANNLCCFNRRRRDDEEVESEENREATVHNTGGCKDYESLDYDRCYNKPYRQVVEVQTGQAWFQTKRELLSWVSIFFVGFFTAIVALFIDTIIRLLTNAKLSTVNRLMLNCDDHKCVASSLFSLIGFNVFFVLLATLLVVYGEPLAAGSGIPEIKCYLNGVKVRNVTRMKTLVCKALGVLFSVSGGLLVGKEGPMIHSGGVIGAGVPQFQLNSLLKWAIPLNYFRSDRDKRDFVSAGAAAGVAAAFGAPIGGVLFSLEEGCSFWNQKLTWKTLFCTMTSTFTLNFFLSGIRLRSWGYFDQSGLLTFGVFQCSSSNPDCHLWTASDLFIFIVIGVGGGIFGFIFNLVNTKLTQWRLRTMSRKNKIYRVVEALMVAATTSLVAYLTPLWVGSCYKIKSEAVEGDYQRFLCGSGEYNDMATLFYNPQEDAIKMLFHGDAGEFSLTTLAVFFIFFFLLSCWTYGSSVPSGLFVPCILCGASYGRFVANFLYSVCGMDSIYLGTFSLIGAAAFLGGVVRMTISLCVILIECTNEISLSLPIMVTLMVAKWAGDMVNEGLYDIHIHLKHVPLLEWESPTFANNLTASDVMSSKLRYLLPHTRLRSVVDMLRTTAHGCFPVVTMAPTTAATSPDTSRVLVGDGDAVESANVIYRCKSYVSRAEVVSSKRAQRRTNTTTSMMNIQYDDVTDVTFDHCSSGGGVNGDASCDVTSDDVEERAMTLHGMILRTQLTTLLHKNISYSQHYGAHSQAMLSQKEMNEDYPNFKDIFEIDLTQLHTSDILDITPYMHPCPYMVTTDSPLPQVFNLFRTMGLRHLPVVNSRGEILGLITRHDITHHNLEAIVSNKSKYSSLN